MRWFRTPREAHCQCGHLRCYHTEGKMGCHRGIVGKTITGEPAWGECQCAYYIPSPAAVDEVEILERMMK